MADIEKTDRKNAKDKHPQSPSSLDLEIEKTEDGENEATNPKTHEAPTQKEEQKMPAVWTTKDVIQTIASALAGIGAIAAVAVVYWMTTNQNEILQKSLQATEDNMALTTEISKTGIQPFISVDTDTGLAIQNLKVGAIPCIYFSIRNSGTTPAYRAITLSQIMFESQFSQDSINMIARVRDTVGWFIGANKTLPPFIATFMGGKKWTTRDSTDYTQGKKPILFVYITLYEDAFGEHHFTQEGFTETFERPYLMGLRKYTRTDYDERQAKKNEKNKTTN